MFFATVKQRQSGAKFLPAIAHSSLFVISFSALGLSSSFVFAHTLATHNAQPKSRALASAQPK
jgi:hypothetical protein